MKVLPISEEIATYLKEHQLTRKFAKQVRLLEQNPQHRSLNLELLEPKDYGVYSFRIDKKYRAILMFWADKKVIEIIKITTHYQ